MRQSPERSARVLSPSQRRAKSRSAPWRKKHSQLQAMLKSARRANGAGAGGDGVWEEGGGGGGGRGGERGRGRRTQHNVSRVTDDRVECPHCLRMFSETAAQRHIPICKIGLKERYTCRILVYSRLTMPRPHQQQAQTLGIGLHLPRRGLEVQHGDKEARQERRHGQCNFLLLQDRGLIIDTVEEETAWEVGAPRAPRFEIPTPPATATRSRHLCTRPPRIRPVGAGDRAALAAPRKREVV